LCVCVCVQGSRIDQEEVQDHLEQEFHEDQLV
jgi:hypothetical protein